MCFRPDTRARRLWEVNLYAMRYLGIKLLLLDADNTLTKWNDLNALPEAAEFVRTAKAAGFGVVVISNNHADRLEPISKQLEINCLPDMHKPLAKKTKAFVESIGLQPRDCAVIGDQILTDVLMGKRLGAHTVLLDPIDLTHEYKVTKFNRNIERLIKKLWKI